MFTKEQLINIGVEGLADIILSLYESKPGIQKQLEIAVARFDSDPINIVSIIRKDIAHLATCDDFIGKYQGDELDELLEEVNEIRMRIMKDVLPKSPAEAVELLIGLLDTEENTCNRIRGDDGMMTEAFIHACADLGSAYESVPNSLEDKVNLVYDRFMNKDDLVYGDIIRDFKVALGDEGLKKLKQKFQQCFKETNNAKNKEGLKILANFQNSVDDYIEACSFGDETRCNDHLEIARRLITDGRAEEALHWLNSIDQATPEFWTRYSMSDKMSLKIKALYLCGKYGEAQAERQKWFARDLSSDMYNEILENTEENCIQSWKDTAFQIALQYKNPHYGLKFFSNIPDFEQAAKFVYEKIDSLNGREFYTLRPIADSLCSTDPLAATLLYRKILEPQLENSRSKSYYYPAKDLISCLSLSSKITDWKGYENHQRYFEKIKLKHGGKRSLWSEYASELNKRQKCEST